MDYSFAGKSVIVTGASAGIGSATAILFAKLGASLAIAGRNVVNLDKVAAECRKVNGGNADKVLTIVGDLTSELTQAAVVDKTMSAYGRIDVLVNNAGMTLPGCNLTKGSIDVYDQIMGVNLRSVVQLTKLCIEPLKASEGAVVNVSSVGSKAANADLTYYCMAKAAMDHMTQCFALEMAPFKVRVNAVNPGAVDTDIYRHLGMDKAALDKMVAGMGPNHPLGRGGQPHEVAIQIAHLAHHVQSAWVTGVLLSIDGGLVLTPDRNSVKI